VPPLPPLFAVAVVVVGSGPVVSDGPVVSVGVVVVAVAVVALLMADETDEARVCRACSSTVLATAFTPSTRA
jgi:hypothetical protein